MTQNKNEQSTAVEEEEEQHPNTVEEEGEEEEENSSDSKLVKEIKKKQKAVTKAKKKVKEQVISKLQVILGVIILAAILMWGGIQNVLHWVSGQTEITIAEKTTSNGCLEVITSENESFCVDQPSYDLAQEGHDYLLEEYQYSYILRTVK